MSYRLTRRFVAFAATAIAVCSLASNAVADDTVLRIGFLRGAEPLSISRINGTLEKRLAPLGVKVSWIGPFGAYAPAAEGLNANSIDLTVGSSTAALSSFSGGAPLSLFAYQWDAGDSAGIVVKKTSPIKTIADLAGHSVAVNRGGTGDYHLAKALEKAGIAPDRVKRVYLNPADGAAAFSQDRVDAWSNWSPFFPIALTEYDARPLVYAKDIGSENAVVFVVRTAYAQANPQVVKAVAEDLQASAKWSREHPEELAKLVETELKLSPTVAKIVSGFQSPDVVPVGERERVALGHLNDWMISQKILPEPIEIEKHVVSVPTQ